MSDKRIPRNIEEIEIPTYKLHIRTVVIRLDEKHRLEPKAEYDLIKETLTKIYKDKLKIDRKMVLKCVSLTCSEDDINYFPYGLIVEKKKEKLIFRTENKRNLLLLLLFINILSFASIAASYAAVDLLSKINLNKDIDGDGIPDINLDLNKDDKAEINIDTNDDDKPNINIDYKDNRLSIFNLDLDKDMKADTNLIVLAENGICKKNQINCDTDGDGWPDTNLDLIGKGIAMIDIDSDEDGMVDLNIDTNSDGVCDLNCDTNGDWKCDDYCISIEYIEKHLSGTSESGNPSATTMTSDPALYVIFTDASEISVSGLFPDDQPGDVLKSVPDKIFTLKNNTPITVEYTVGWVNVNNTFETGNFKFKVASTPTGGNLDWTTYPKVNTVFLTATINPYETQTYTVSSKLQGINASQNKDQGRIFSGKIEVKETDNPNNLLPTE